MWRRLRTRKVPLATLGCFLISLVLLQFPLDVSAESYECKDLSLVFLRGSGQNGEGQYLNDVFNPNTFGKVEKESYSFFNWFKTHLDAGYPHVDYKAVSIHDFPGKYDDVGYRAARVGFTWLTDPQSEVNSINAEASWFPGDYQESTTHGIAETVGYLKDQINNCPNQSIAIGGYSQGAQVMGEALFQLTEQERQHIVTVGLFGDPKFIGSSKGLFLPIWEKTISFPWRRGTATDRDTGVLEPRFPYLPEGIDRRAVSYCNREDIVCSGWTGKPFDKTAHSSYSEEPMRNTVNEMMQWAAPQLLAAERRNGGLGGTDPSAPTAVELAKTRDIMFLLNDDSGQSVLNTFRYQLDPVLYPITQQYANTQYGAKGYGEGEQGGQYLPRVNNIQALLPYVGYNPANPNSVSNISSLINSRYPFAGVQMGGGDYADPHGLAVEKSVFAGGWRAEAEKHLVLITDRPAKQTYSYNICNATVRSWLQIPNTNGYEACYTNFGHDVWPKVLHPEVCQTVLMAITQQECANPLQTPGYTQLNTRTLEDGILAAQSQNIAVDIVVPYKITDPYNQFGVDNMMHDLRYLAESTGGKFIYYDQRTQFDKTLLTDTVRQIFGHTPTRLQIVHAQPAASSGFDDGTVAVATGSPVILDVSQSNQHYDEYKWDFNNDGTWDQTTEGPVAETTFAQSYSGFARVLGVNTDGVSGQVLVPVVVSQLSASEPVLPQVPDVAAQTNPDGTIALTWQSDQPGQLLVVDPRSHLPVAIAPLNSQSLTIIPEEPYDQLQLFVLADQAHSEPSLVTVQPYVPPSEEDPGQTNDQTGTTGDEAPGTTQDQTETAADEDETLCYKLQTCHTGSNPNQPIVLPASTNQLQVPVQHASVVTAPTSLVATTAVISNAPQVQAATISTPQTVTNTSDTDHASLASTASAYRSDHKWWFYVLATALFTAAILGGFRLVYRLGRG